MDTSSAPREWDATGYDDLPLPHERWGAQLRDALVLRGDERVLDVGAGTGRDSAALLGRLPHGHLTAVDGSAAMLARLRRRLAALPEERWTALQADLRHPLHLPRPVDVVFSVATFHWVPDHPTLFRSLAANLRPGGLLHAEWGGTGNLAAVDAALRELGLTPVNDSLTFAGARDTADRLTAAGFVDIDVALVPDPALLPASRLEAFLATVVLGTVLDPLEADRRTQVVRAVAARLPRSEVDYVRLQVTARRPG